MTNEATQSLHAKEFAKHELNRKLTAAMQQNTGLAREAITSFERSEPTVANRLKLNTRLLELANDILQAGDWESSLLLHNVAESIRAERDLLQEQHEMLIEEAAPASARKQSIADDERLLYLSLYQVDGYSLSKWAQLLRGLERYNLSRPVYKLEEQVQKAIRSRGYPITEGYAVVAVKKANIRAQESAQSDRWGQELLSLAENSIQTANIIEFVHVRKKYQFIDGALKLDEEAQIANSAGGNV